MVFLISFTCVTHCTAVAHDIDGALWVREIRHVVFGFTEKVCS